MQYYIWDTHACAHGRMRIRRTFVACLRLMIQQQGTFLSETASFCFQKEKIMGMKVIWD